ncbi:MAG: type II toxin-antitoxin system RelE/ParE family toxin, partial [Telluria sp.]
MRLVYSEEAVADLVRLRAFIAEKDPSAAARVAAELIARIENLRLFPTMGRAV